MLYYIQFYKYAELTVIKMNVAIFTEVLAPYVCGISSYVDVLKKGLEALGNKVIIVTSSLHTDRSVFKEGIVRCPAKKSMNKYGYQCKNINDKYVMKFLTKFKPDVIHIQTDTKIGYMALNIADKLRCPVVFSVHDYYSDRFASDSSVVTWRIKTFFEKKHFCDMIDNANIIASSNKRAASFVRAAGRNRKVRLIPSATDRSEFDYKNSSGEAVRKLRKKLGLPLNAVVAVFAGNLSVDKNLEFMLSAFSRHIKKTDNIHLLIVGDGTETEHLKALCGKFKIRECVHFAGAVAHSLMPAIYSACDIYVCSSDDSLMSMSFVEAMSCGLPVLVKEDKEKFAYNMIKDGVNGFVCKNEAGFAKYLKKLSSFEPHEKRQMRRIVRKSMVDTDAEYMAKCTVKVYEQAIKSFNLNINIIVK